MSIKDKLLGKAEVTRRTFLKGASAAGAAAALYGCGGGKGKTYMEEDTDLSVPSIEGKIIAGGTPHNCGGRCVSRYYVVDGVIKRIVTDERTDKDLDHGDDPQYRSCVRCHSRKQWFYRNDRLLYPLKQTGTRGDISTFQRISWEQAYAEIATKLQSVYNNYGAEAVHVQYASGDVTGWSTGAVGRLLNMMGGSTSYYLSYSSPTLQHVARFVDGTGFSNPNSNSKQDALNADNLVLWSCNYLESIIGTNSGWYLTQIKEKGVPITAVDVRVSKTASTVATDFVDVEPSTDAALVLGMLYRIIVERYSDVDTDFINNYVFGFFDNGNTLYHADVDASYYKVPDGGSLSAYILGDNNFLVGKNHNNATSIYPETIGYNVNSDDELYGKKVHIWGQDAKTPEWAEAITGVPADKIRELAEIYLTGNVSTWIGSGYQRHTESEQAVWLNRIFSVVTKNFGATGCSSGFNTNNVTASVPDTLMSAGVSNSVSLASTIYDTARLTSDLSYVPTSQRGNIPVFVVPDAVDNNDGSGKSKWHDGQVEHLPAGFGKMIFVTGGNILANQSGDVNYNLDIYTDKTKCECIVNFDHFMTPTAAISDYILPSTMQGEKPGAVNNWNVGEVCIRLNKVSDIPGEVMDEYSICAGIADKLGLKSDYLAGYAEGQEGMEARVKAGWNAANLSTKYGMSYDEWVDAGIVSLHGTYSTYNIPFKAFRTDPANNPVGTASGKIEAYCLNMMEDYEARYHENLDTVTTDGAGLDTLYTGSIYSKHHGSSTARRFVYPIPMYIPTVEGRHAVDTEDSTSPYVHDDPLGLNSKGYTYTLHTWHLQYRSHSTLNNIAYLDECYKKDGNGEPAYLDPNRSYTDGVWDDGVYEPIWINPKDAQALSIQTGDRVLISNDRGKMYASAIVTNRVRPKIIHIGQGSWHKFDSNGIDIGGCGNTVITARPSRICKGMTSANDCRVKIVKA